MRNHFLAFDTGTVMNFRHMTAAILRDEYHDDSFCAGCFSKILKAKYCQHCDQAYCEFCNGCEACRAEIDISYTKFFIENDFCFSDEALI